MKSHRAFTLVELCISMVIFAMIMSAVAGFSMAMTTAWKSAEKSQAVAIRGNQIAARLQNEIRKAKLIGVYRAGSADGSATGAAVMLWVQDTNGDGYIQGDEVEMIEHDTTAHTLVRYYNGQSDGAGTWSYTNNFNSSTVFTQFKLNRQSIKLAGGVYGAIFETSGTTGTSLNPNLNFGLKLMTDDSQPASVGSAIGGTTKLMIEYGSATVRAPLAAPSN
jgi:prepilin-type N-terminal cleavage/methylation domain-containing protein